MVDSSTEPAAIWERFECRERLAINLTLTCNLSCAHCIVESSPQRKEHLSTTEVQEALRAGVALGKRHVTFSGGEVFLFPDQMYELISLAVGLGYVVDIESNGFWARSPETARRKLAPFVAAGISGLALSADAYHTEFFPVQRTIYAAAAARGFGLVHEIDFCPSPWPEIDAGIEAALTAAGEPYIRNELLDRGRGKELWRITDRRPLAELPDCDSLTTTVHATGDAYACCELDLSTDAMKRTPVFLGSLRNPAIGTEQLAERERLVTGFYDPESPIYFRKLAAEHELFAELNDRRYQNICDFCMTALADPARVAALRVLLDAATGTDPLADQPTALTTGGRTASRTGREMPLKSQLSSME